MADPWLSEEDLQKAVEEHDLTKQAEDIRKQDEKNAEELHKAQVEQQKKIDEGELEPVYAGGARVGVRPAGEDVASPQGGAPTEGESVRPKAEAEAQGAAPDESVGVVGSADDPEASEQQASDDEKKSSRKK